MSGALRFEVLIAPNVPWETVLERFRCVEALGFDLGGVADHFVDWTNPVNPWFDLWTTLGAVAQATTTLRLRPCVAQIPLRDPATFARQALSLDHISGGRIELGLGIGLTIDPSYRMMGVPNWTPRERVARLKEYLEIVDRMLTREVTSYAGEFYTIDEAVMHPRPLQSPRPPIMVAAMGPMMLMHAARYADSWNSLSFAEDFDSQLAQTRERAARIDEHCAAIGRDPATLVRSYTMFDSSGRKRGGRIAYYESEEAFAEMVGRVLELGITEIGLYWPAQPEQRPMFERIATGLIPKIKAARAAGRDHGRPGPPAPAPARAPVRRGGREGP